MTFIDYIMWVLKGYRSKNIENLSELFGKKKLKKGLP